MIQPWPMWRQHLIALGTVSAIAAVVVWSRRPPVEVWGQAEIPAQVKAGSKFKVVRYGKFTRTDCHRVVSTWIVDSQGTPWPRQISPTGNAVDPSARFIAREASVPFSAAWGTARYLQQVNYSCFPFWELWPIVLDLPPLSFTITPPE